MLMTYAGQGGHVCGHAAVAAALKWPGMVRVGWLWREAGTAYVGAHW